MAVPMTKEREHYIELENTKARMRGYKSEVGCLKEEIARYKREVNNMRQKMGDLESVVRDVLDEISYEDDTTDTQELRKRLWNDSDTEQRIDAEGYKP